MGQIVTRRRRAERRRVEKRVEAMEKAGIDFDDPGMVMLAMPELNVQSDSPDTLHEELVLSKLPTPSTASTQEPTPSIASTHVISPIAASSQVRTPFVASSQLPTPFATSSQLLTPSKSLSQLTKERAILNEGIVDTITSSKKCPYGGPGGLICCGPCTASYSKMLTETAQEMEIQMIAKVGREVSEMLELLQDAKARLHQTVDISNSHDVRRSLLEKNEKSMRSSLRPSEKVSNGVTYAGMMDFVGTLE